MIKDIEASFQAAKDFSLFSGITMRDAEAGWYGFKHYMKTGVCIVMNGKHGEVVKLVRDNIADNGTWRAFFL